MMRRNIIRLGFLVVLALSLAGFAQAQKTSAYKVHIPFDFKVGGKSFEAGDYAVTFGGVAGSRERLIIQSEKGKNSAMLVVSPSEKIEDSAKSALVFNVYENLYFLAGIETPQTSAEILKSKKEIRLAKNAKRVEVALKK